MNILDIILIGVGLAMDAFALTIANCTTYKDTLNRKKEWSMPIAFAIFQFLMPVIGFYIGSTFANSVKSVAGYITFAVFFLLSFKIVFDNVKEIVEQKKGIIKEEKVSKFTIWLLLIQAILTSIDALLIGASKFALSLKSPFIPSLIVGAITFVIVTVALLVGKGLGKVLKKYAEWAGAIILFGLAVKELVLAIIG